jgi:uncharacterized membrane protein YczE
LRKAIAYLLGLIILACGIALVIRADIGAGAWDALNVGLSRKVGLSIGSWVILVGIIVMLLNSLLLGERPDFASILTVLIIGPLVDAWMWLIHVHPPTFSWKLTLFAMGMTVIAIGLAVYLQANFAPTPIDKLMYAISLRTGLSLRASKTVGELAALLLAWLTGGPIGLGTLLITFGIGPLLQFFLSRVEPLFARKPNA